MQKPSGAWRSRKLVEVRLDSSGSSLPDSRVAWFDGFALQHLEVQKASQISLNWNTPCICVSLLDLRLREGAMRFDGGKVPLAYDLRDKVSVCPADRTVEMSMRLMQRKNRIFLVYIDPGFVESELGPRYGESFSPSANFDDAALLQTLVKLKSLGTEFDPIDALYAKHLVIQAAIEMVRHHQARAPRVVILRGQLTGSQQKIIGDAIDDAPEDPWSLSELAYMVGLSRFHFARAFKKTFGLSPLQFITNRRIEAAKVELLNGDSEISKVAVLVGYRNASRFSEVFKRAIGMTPIQYRRSYRSANY